LCYKNSNIEGARNQTLTFARRMSDERFPRKVLAKKLDQIKAPHLEDPERCEDHVREDVSKTD
jgi:hypothetical protein